jgi:hypothetical protein
MYFYAHRLGVMNTDYSEWSEQELRQAEATASQFLHQNAAQIVETLQAKLRFLDFLIRRLDQRDAPLDYRLDCFARIAEVSRYMKDDAEGFFQLASHPIVARLLHDVPHAE